MNIMLALAIYQDRLVFSLLDLGIQKKLSSQLYSFFVYYHEYSEKEQ